MSAPTYRLQEFPGLAGVTARAVRYYVQRGIVPAPEPRGVATVYTQEQLARVKAIAILRKRERLRLPGVKPRLEGMSLAEVEALVASAAPPSGGAKSAEAGAGAGAAAAIANSEARPPYPATRWDHVELLPGLELRVRSDAGSVVRRLAQEIFAQYGAAASPPAVASRTVPE
jgi:DNA-binding transcriptional MerR regulator